ncbi:MAG: Uma2 family endonuclease [Acidobacteria bacterium]|nr:Uma2 family endonuclease [Acidobacteriota bacterium]
MSAVLEPTIIETVTAGVRLRRIRASEYERMIEAGIYTENDRLELLNGEIIEIMPKGPKHTSVNSRILRYLIRLMGDRAIVRSQDPIRLDDFSEPEPDVVLAEPTEDEYAENHPTPADILLIVEISDTTLVYDREDKSRAYSRNGIRHYLLINLQDETIEDYREPGADGYGSKRTCRRGDRFNLVAFPEIEIGVEDLL